MKSFNTHSAGWLIVGLAVWPLMWADAGQDHEVASTDARLERLLTMHDVTQAIHVQQTASGDCAEERMERSR